MTEHIDVPRLNDYLEGLVSRDEARRIQTHVSACGECGEELETLQRFLSDLGTLPAEGTPSRDLWPDIRSRMDAEEAPLEHEYGSTSFQSAGARRGRRFTLSWTQLLAASIALVFLSGGSVWLMLHGTGTEGAARLATEAALPADVSPAMRTATTEYEQAIASLETVLERGRTLLDPETLATVESSLRIVDEAIDEARKALAEDPNNDLLNRLLIQNQQSKLRVLRQVSAAVQG